MADYQVDFRGSAKRELYRLDRQMLERVVAAIDELKNQPRPVGMRKLVGTEHTYRIRVGDYRVINTIDDAHRAVTIERVRHRSDAYR
jgi:mRNA interferase RelE/StbE